MNEVLGVKEFKVRKRLGQFCRNIISSKTQVA